MVFLHTVVVLIFVLWFSHLNYETSPVCVLHINTYFPVIIICKSYIMKMFIKTQLINLDE